jgi:hypothetical protein
MITGRKQVIISERGVGVPTMEWIENARKFQKRIENDFILQVALQRIRNCDDRILILSGLGLMEIPPLPEGITILRCELNQLTSLPTLPSSLTFLSCDENLLTSLPTLPSSLKYLSCSDNLLSSLPSLPSSLIALTCIRNELTSLPPLPLSLMRLCIDQNNITHLPEFSPMKMLSCSYNQLTSLPPLPSLRSLLLFGNPLEILPELPLTLIRMVYVLPHNSEQFEVERLTPEQIQQINRDNQEWMEAHSMGRCMWRCSVYYEELMHDRWNPDRVKKLLGMGYTPEDM